MERRQFEELLGMGSGYVSDFSNSTFQEFVADAVGEDIFADRYDHASGSKANRLRGYWKIEPNYKVGRLMAGLIDYEVIRGRANDDAALVESCRKTVRRLIEGAPVADLDAIAPNSTGKTFEALARSVRDAIENHEPEIGLDRLHTFIVKYVRTLCEKHGIVVTKEKALHSIFGEYVKNLAAEGHLKASMTERILKSNISTLEAFNHVRNDQSLAHDNEVLGYDESLLICNSVCSLVRFLETIEERVDRENEAKAQSGDFVDDLPF